MTREREKSERERREREKSERKEREGLPCLGNKQTGAPHNIVVSTATHGVVERSVDISPVDGGVKGQVLPVLPL